MTNWKPMVLGDPQRPEKKGQHVIVKVELGEQPPEAWSRYFNKLALNSKLKPPVTCAGACLSFEIRYGDRASEDLHGTEILGFLASTNHWYANTHLPAVDVEDAQRKQDVQELSDMHERLRAKLRPL